MAQTFFKYWSASFYDFLLWSAFPERKIKKAMIGCIDFLPNQNILDFGCGTGTLLLMVKQKFSPINLTGIDVSDQMVRYAKRKIKKVKLYIPVLT